MKIKWRKVRKNAVIVSKLSFIGAIAGAILYVSVNARNTRDLLVYSKGVTRGLASCKNPTLKTSMPSGAIESIEPWLTVESL